MASRYPRNSKRLNPEEILAAMDELNDSTEKLEQLLGSDSGSDKNFELMFDISSSDSDIFSDIENHQSSHKRKKKSKNSMPAKIFKHSSTVWKIWVLGLIGILEVNCTLTTEYKPYDRLSFYNFTLNNMLLALRWAILS